jgi:hypothetical protein
VVIIVFKMASKIVDALLRVAIQKRKGGRDIAMSGVDLAGPIKNLAISPVIAGSADHHGRRDIVLARGRR